MKYFLQDQSMPVRIRQYFLDTFLVENGMPQRSIVSHLFFSIMINDMFENLKSGMGFS